MNGSTFVPHILFGLDPILVSTLILVITYAVIIWDRINRAIVALVGGSAAVLLGALDQAEAIKSIDWNTIGVLAGMMIITSIAQRSGVFQYLAIRSAQLANASPARVLVLLQCVTAVLSAFLNNVTTVLLIAPVTLAVTQQLRVRSYPFLFAEVFASNIGGTATLIGDPPNIMIGSQAGLDFNAFLINVMPVIVIVQLAQIAMVHLAWGHELRSTPEGRAHVMALDAQGAILDRALLWQSLAVLAGAILALVLADRLRLEPATISIAAAAILMLLDNWEHRGEKQSDNVTRTLTEIEWITIIFFVGLFVVVHTVEVSGLLQRLANALVAATGGSLPGAGFAILWVSALLSAVIDNIPFVATMIPLIKEMAPAYGGPDKIEALWWCLSLGACLGGNGTLIGAAANLTIAGIAERSGVPFRFVAFTLKAFPMMLVSIAICHVYVWWRYFL
jgi:Na+/H+ antiporter NhaD/arsenite permease-like protein